MVRVDVGDEDYPRPQSHLIDLLQAEVVEQLVVGTLPAVQQDGVLRSHLDVNAGDIPVLTGFHGTSAQENYLGVDLFEVIVDLGH